jgi:phenylalanyl-tRNA synthetase beta chain
VVPEQTNYLEIEACIREIAGDLLTNLLLFDVYSGQNVEKTYKSLAMGLILQDVSSTLLDEDVNLLVSRVVTALETHLNAKLRG